LSRYLDISDGNMEEGSLRCDVNISIRPYGQEELGTKVEVKNLNSFRNVQKAIDFEFNRQIDSIVKGERIHQETRNYDASQNKTIALRSKEEAHDYRYFPEPDLQPLIVDEDKIQKARSAMPSLPWERLENYTSNLGLSRYDASVLTEDKDMSDFFESIIENYSDAKAVANILNTQVRSYLNEKSVALNEYPVSATDLAELLKLIKEGKVSHSIGMQRILPEMEKGSKLSPLQIAEANHWIQESNSDSLIPFIDQALSMYPDKVEEYKSGKKGLLGLFMGEVMKLSKGTADPKLCSQLIREKLEN
jgi:aspartyl-tRNA(Asn)/glutamyl-tRNA(Gln) amidotransferase subunit B